MKRSELITELAREIRVARRSHPGNVLRSVSDLADELMSARPWLGSAFDALGYGENPIARRRFWGALRAAVNETL